MPGLPGRLSSSVTTEAMAGQSGACKSRAGCARPRRWSHIWHIGGSQSSRAASLLNSVERSFQFSEAEKYSTPPPLPLPLLPLLLSMASRLEALVASVAPAASLVTASSSLLSGSAASNAAYAACRDAGSAAHM